MRKSTWLISAGLLAFSMPAYAQSTDTDGAAAQPTDGATAEAAAVANQATETSAQPDTGEIIVTATRRNEALSDVPLAVSAVTAQTLENSGVSDLRQLNQVSPSLLVSSTSSEAGGGGARIRGVGTVGDNPGLESSVAVFIDGVYRSRVGVGLTELGQIDRVEVLRGPQGTLFGRNASAGLVSVITAKPKFQPEYAAEVTVGNHNLRRGEVSATGPVSETLAYRLDAIGLKRDGYLTDVISGRDLNNRNRGLVRGQLLWEPDSKNTVRVTADVSKRNEECCGASWLDNANVVANGSGGYTRIKPNSILQLERSLGAIINENTFARETAITPGRSYRSDVKDYGVSVESVNDFNFAELTSIVAYRANEFIRGQDADFNNLDLIFRDDDGGAKTRFGTLTIESRLQGEAGPLNWLVGVYSGNEKLKLDDNLSSGADWDRFVSAQVSTQVPGFPGYAQLNSFARGFALQTLATNPAFAAVPAAARPTIANIVAAQVSNTPISNMLTEDHFKQTDNNLALFTHNIYKVTDKLSLTAGVRYTRDKKTLSADLNSTSQCANYLNNIVKLKTLAATAQANPALYGALTPAIVGLATGLAGPAGLGNATFAGAPCVLNSVNGDYSGGKKKEAKVSGTGVASYKLFDDTMIYASYSRGYKAGGFNLDRMGLTYGAVDLNDLQFAPETVNAYEAGLKYNGRGLDVNLAVFRQDFKNFQLNTFNGINFVVENINSCSDSLNGADTDTGATQKTVACGGKTKSGVSTFGVEAEGFFKPFANATAALGATYVDTRYKHNLIGSDGNSLIPALFQLPGRKLSNAPEFTMTGSFGYTPPIGTSGMKGLAYVDFRHSSSFNTGSDLDLEKVQKSFFLLNARVGLTGPKRAWGLELWAQNLLDKDYTQVTVDGPLQGSGSTRAVQEGFATSSTATYAAFLGEPRTFGLTLRGKF